jgi:hypothetical protein
MSDFVHAVVLDVLTKTLAGLGVTDANIGDNTHMVADLSLSSVDIIHVLATSEDQLGVVLALETLLAPDGRAMSDLTVREMVDALSVSPLSETG